MNALAGVAILLKAGGIVASLMIEQQEVRALADFLEIAERAGLGRYRAAVHARPDAIGPAGSLRDAVVEFPEFGAARVAPQDPLAVGGIVPIGAARNRLTGLNAELPLAVVAVADATAPEPGPTVIGKSFGLGSLDDFAQNVGQIFVVVAAVDAGGVLVGRAVGLPIGGAREPIRVGLVGILARSAGIHARHHG